jgi:ATP synthase protein I
MQRASTGNLIPRPPVNRVLLIEFVLLLLGTAAMWSINAVAGRSILLGGLIFLLPQSWFAWRVFRVSGAKAASEVVSGFYRGEAGKFLLAAAAFVGVFVFVKPLNAAAFFGAYIALHIVNAVLLIRFR